MIRLTWLQFRMQALVGAAALAVVAIVLAITAPSLHHLYTTVLDCHVARDCSAAASAFLDKDHSLQVMLNVLVEVARDWSGSSGGHPSSPASSKPAPTAWPGRRRPAPAGLPSSSPGSVSRALRSRES